MKFQGVFSSSTGNIKMYAINAIAKFITARFLFFFAALFLLHIVPGKPCSEERKRDVPREVAGKIFTNCNRLGEQKRWLEGLRFEVG